ncbi:MAG: hypothetical protein AAGD38_05715 [Acidobacteriota bacterium]
MSTERGWFASVVLASFAVVLSAWPVLAVPSPDRVTAGAASDDVALQQAGVDVLFSSFSGIASGPFTVSSQLFLDLFVDPPTNSVRFASAGADDFEVTGDGWRIEEIAVRGTYFFGSGPAESVSVYFIADDAGLPATTDLSGGAIRAYEGIGFVDVEVGDFRITLVDGDGNPDPLTLRPGVYWVVVRANMGFVSGGQWGWTESAAGANSGLTNGAESAWMQNAPFLPGIDGENDCVDEWGPRVTECGLTGDGLRAPPERDFAFEMRGRQLVAGVEVSPLSIETSEAGATGSFDVVLTAPPGAEVTVPIGAAPAIEGMVDPGSLSFGPETWMDPQTVTVTSVDDAIPEATVVYALVNGPTSSADMAFDGLVVDDVEVSHVDDDIAGLSVVPTSDLSIDEGGTTASFTVALNTPLAAGEQVTLPLTTMPVGIATVLPQVVFDSGTSSIEVVVTPVDDDVAQGEVAFTIVTGNPTSNNPIYDVLDADDIADVSGTRADDDVAGVVVEAGTPPLMVTEQGSSQTFTVRLRSEPMVPITIQLFSTDETEGIVAPTSLVFDDTTWDVPAEVEVVGQDDDFDDDDFPFVVVLEPLESVDPFYDGIDPADVACVTVDDDQAGFELVPLAGLITTEDGDMDVFTVRLTSEPFFDDGLPVSLPLTVLDSTEGELSTDGMVFGSTAELFFDGDTWDLPQTLWLRGIDDNELDGDRPYIIETGDVGGDDLVYFNLDAEDVADLEATNLENDTFVDIPTLDAAALAVLVVMLALVGVVFVSRRR